MKKLGSITVNREVISIMLASYSNGAPALELVCDSGPYARFSVNIPTCVLGPGDVLVKTWAENEALRAPMLATGLFEDTGIRIPTGHVDAELWKMKLHP